MKAYFQGDRLLTIEGTPQEVALFMDIRAMGPKVPEEKPKTIPFTPWGPYVTTGGITGVPNVKPVITSGDPPAKWVDNGWNYVGITYAEKPE